MVKLVDTLDSGSSGSNPLEVQVLSAVPKQEVPTGTFYFDDCEDLKPKVSQIESDEILALSSPRYQNKKSQQGLFILVDSKMKLN